MARRSAWRGNTSPTPAAPSTETHWDKTIFSAVRSLTALRPKISGRTRIYAQGELVVIEREKLTLAVNATTQPLTFERQNCYHIIGARSYLILDREETV